MWEKEKQVLQKNLFLHTQKKLHTHTLCVCTKSCMHAVHKSKRCKQKNKKKEKKGCITLINITHDLRLTSSESPTCICTGNAYILATCAQKLFLPVQPMCSSVEERWRRTHKKKKIYYVQSFCYAGLLVALLYFCCGPNNCQTLGKN